MGLKSIRVRNASRSTAGSLVAAAALLASLAVSPAVAEPWPEQVDATYRITFNGFDIGSFAFQARVEGTGYAVASDANISALFGAFKWRGISRSSGVVDGREARPAGYTFDFNGTGKSGSIKVGFTRGAVSSATVLPPAPRTDDTVPVASGHLKGVLDPLSAVLAMSRTAGRGPCDRRLPIFDGKQRFDLSLTYLRQQPVAETRPSGQPGVAIVCRVRYLPIAGHRTNGETRYMAENDGIEIAFRPVPAAGIFVPYQITIPTIAGSAVLTSENVQIRTRREQIALRH